MQENFMHLQELKPQRWRSLAIMESGEEALICLGQSIVQIRESYVNAWIGVFTKEARAKTKEVIAQKWVGISSHGYWKFVMKMPHPKQF